MIKYIGLGVSVLFVLGGLAVGIAGLVLPHWGLALTGAIMTAIFGYSLALSVKWMIQDRRLNS